MCPVQSVTYVSGRSRRTEWIAPPTAGRRKAASGKGLRQLNQLRKSVTDLENPPMKSLEKRLPESHRNWGRVPKNSAAAAVVTRDNGYAFISVEGVGTDPGTVEAIDLQ
jgi:hypothetical protein